MKILTCRNCKTKLNFLFSLGKISFTGKFPKKSKDKKSTIRLGYANNVNLLTIT